MDHPVAVTEIDQDGTVMGPVLRKVSDRDDLCAQIPDRYDHVEPYDRNQNEG
jgi:hypothetical protein